MENIYVNIYLFLNVMCSTEKYNHVVWNNMRVNK